MTRQRTLLATFLILAVAGAYANSFGIDFEQDDAYIIVQNPAIRSLANIPRFFIDSYTLSNRPGEAGDVGPVLTTTYALNYAISGLKPWSWHLVGILIHLVAVGLVFVIVRDFLWRDGGEVAAGVAALVFALAPINSESVVYQSARSASLATVFYLAAFLFALRRRPLAMAGFQALSLLTKALAVTLPATLLLYAFCYLPDEIRKPGHVIVKGGKKPEHPRRVFWLMASIAGVLDVIYLSYRQLLVPPNVLRWHEPWATPWVWLMTEWSVYLTYVRRFVWPSDLSIDHQNVYVFNLADPRAWIPLLLILGWLGVAWKYRARWPLIAFATGWYFLTLAPESTLMALAETENDHRPYLPAALGLAPLVAFGIIWGVRKKALIPVCALLALAAGAVIHERNYVWSDTVRLWTATTVTDPLNGRAWMNAGVGLMARGQYPEARRMFTEAKRLYPGYAFVYANLSVLDAAEGHLQASLENAETAARLDPTWTGARLYVAQAKARLADAPR